MTTHSKLHASEHTNGTDDVQNATAAQKGLATAAQILKLDGIDTGADVTGDNAPQAHHDSHDPEDGSDALDCAAPSELATVQAAAEGTAHEFARADHAHQIQAAITDNHLVTIDGTTNQPVSTDYAKFTAEGLEVMEKSQILSDLNVADGADVTGSNAPQAHASSHASTGGDSVDHDTLTNYVVGQHRVINDAGTGATELWSASKIDSEISALSSGVRRKAAVIDYVDNTAAPPTEVDGDRYILQYQFPLL